MKFVSEAVEKQFELLHPETRLLFTELDAQHAVWRQADPTFPELTLTCIVRNYIANRAIYGKDQFTWHDELLCCAGDMRTKHYRVGQLARVAAWLLKRCSPKAMWELIMKDHGTGPHFHVAYRDYGMRKAAGL